MQDIYEYIKLSRTERTTHIRLDTPCIERGGEQNANSYMCRGLLAHTLDTTVPNPKLKIRICICHACNNKNCLNPEHLYWGTDKDNLQDRIDLAKTAGTYKTLTQLTVEKYGAEKAAEMRREASAKGGRSNVNKQKSPEHKAKIAAAMSK